MDLLTFLKKKENTKDTAKDRLKLVLVHDRSNCSTHILELLKNDIFKVISNYMDIDEQELDMQISKTDQDGFPVLYANIPIKGMRKSNE